MRINKRVCGKEVAVLLRGDDPSVLPKTKSGEDEGWKRPT